MNHRDTDPPASPERLAMAGRGHRGERFFPGREMTAREKSLRRKHEASREHRVKLSDQRSELPKSFKKYLLPLGD